MSMSDTPDPAPVPRERPAASGRKDRPALSPEQVLAWADAFYARHGRWPQASSGLIEDAAGETWLAVDAALRKGWRGLPGGLSLYRLIRQHRAGRAAGLVDEGISDPDPIPRRKQRPPDLEIEQTLAWADAHFARAGRWPTKTSGPVLDAPREKWGNIAAALSCGRRGLKPGLSLAHLLAQYRGVRHRLDLPRLCVAQILAWADAHYERTGRWPDKRSGPIHEAPQETWSGISNALHQGNRGLAPGSSLPRLLAEHRRVRNPKGLPPLTEAQILAWAEAHHTRTGEWPSARSGPVVDAPGETWTGVETALAQGKRGLPGGSSIARLLDEHWGTRQRRGLYPLSDARILAWADAHFERTGQWPNRNSGPIDPAPGEAWSGIERALRRGFRGLAGGSSLARLLATHRAVRNIHDLPPLTAAQILLWADEHQQRTGAWPLASSGAIAEAPGENWQAVDGCLQSGCRGLPGGSSLARVLAECRGARNRKALPPLPVRQILLWADAFRARHGHWPALHSGPVEDAPGETWSGLNAALQHGNRGLPGGSSLPRLLEEQRGVRNCRNLPPLTVEQILAWADAFHARQGCWPSGCFGPIEDAPGETWTAVESALRNGARGLPGGSSLARLIRRYRSM
jgi:hypothetical protein